MVNLVSLNDPNPPKPAQARPASAAAALGFFQEQVTKSSAIQGPVFSFTLVHLWFFFLFWHWAGPVNGQDAMVASFLRANLVAAASALAAAAAALAAAALALAFLAFSFILLAFSILAWYLALDFAALAALETFSLWRFNLRTLAARFFCLSSRRFMFFLVRASRLL